MAYTPPLGTSADFSTLSLEFPVPYNGLGFFLGGGYTAPIGDSVQANFPAPPADYVFPLGTAANFTAIGDTVWVANGAASVSFTAEGHAEYQMPSGIAHGSASVSFTAEGHTQHGVNAHGSATVSFSASGAVGHGVAGLGAAAITFSAAGSGRVERYDLAGEVRLQSVLVNRTVRAYRRDTGALVGEQVTVGGRFKMHAGFAAREHYIIPVDLDDLAEDFAPPCANRVVSILAVDA
jgi:hypothetical protein